MRQKYSEKRRLNRIERTHLAFHRMEKARQDLFHARWELNRKSYDWSIYHSFFAAFNAMRALVALKRPSFSSEENEIEKFNYHFVSRKLFPPRQSRVVENLRKLKEETVWGNFLNFTRNDAKAQIETAEKFIATVDSVLTKLIIQIYERHN
jgi:uncharacterized protein (UPF0332 family)